MSRCTIRGPASPPRSPVGATRSDSRSVEIDRVLSRPVRVRPGQRVEMVLVGEARDRRGRAAAADRPRGSGSPPPARSCGIRPRSSRLATSEVMNTVLPARLRPVTPSRTTGSRKHVADVAPPRPRRRGTGRRSSGRDPRPPRPPCVRGRYLVARARARNSSAPTLCNRRAAALRGHPCRATPSRSSTTAALRRLAVAGAPTRPSRPRSRPPSPASNPGAGASPAPAAPTRGVHALGQVAHLDLTRAWDPSACGRRSTPTCARPRSPSTPPPRSRPTSTPASRRSSANTSSASSPAARRSSIDRGLAWRVGHPLDLAAMRAAAGALVGRHDFTTFRSSLCQAEEPGPHPRRRRHRRDRRARRRRVPLPPARALLPAQPGPRHRRHPGARRRRRLAPGRVAEALAARDRAACGPVCPPDGLYLVAVRYPEDPFPPEALIARRGP